MQVREVMTRQVACATADSNLHEVARLMVERDCGAIPIVEDEESRRPIGVVTDRDIATRAVAQGKNPLEMRARDVMSGECKTVTAEASLADCCAEMQDNQIRRVIVTDRNGRCSGIVALADVAIHASNGMTGEVVRQVSQPTVVGAR
jgi:CBS domain-containing protein